MTEHDELHKVWDLSEKIGFCMLTTQSGSDLRARPMSAYAERVDNAIHGTIDRVDNTAEHLKSSVMDKVNYAAGIVRGVRAAIVSLLHTDHRPKPSATAAGQL